jgi:hypothetical protein
VKGGGGIGHGGRGDWVEPPPGRSLGIGGCGRLWQKSSRNHSQMLQRLCIVGMDYTIVPVFGGLLSARLIALWSLQLGRCALGGRWCHYLILVKDETLLEGLASSDGALSIASVPVKRERSLNEIAFEFVKVTASEACGGVVEHWSQRRGWAGATRVELTPAKIWGRHKLRLWQLCPASWLKPIGRFACLRMVE